MIVDNLEFHVKRSGDTAARGTDRLSKSLKNLKGSSSGANKGLGGLLHTIGRLSKMMILRQIIRAVMKAMKEGLENAYQFNSMVGGEMSAALDSLKSAATQATGALGSAFGEMIANVAPIIIRLLELITRVANAFAQLMAVLGGRSKYTKAVSSSEKWAKATEKGAKAAKEWKNQLMGFDEINRLEDQSDNGSGSGGDDPYEGAFELVDAENEWAKQLRSITMDWWNSLNLDPIINAWDRLKTSLKELAGVIDDYLYFAYTEVLLPIGTWTIEEALPAVIHTLASAFEFLAEALNFLKPYALWIFENWLKPLANWAGDHFVWAMWRVQDAFVMLREYVKSLEGLSLKDALAKIFNDVINWIYTYPWHELGSKIYNGVKTALSFVKSLLLTFLQSGAIKKIIDAIGDIVGAVIKTMSGVLLGFLTDLISDVGQKIQHLGEVENLGKYIFDGIINGILLAVKAIGGFFKWIWDHIFTPFIDAFKQCFGIHSPSTVMEEMGGYIMQGLGDGLTNNFRPIQSAVDQIKSIFGGISDVVSSVWDRVVNLFYDARTTTEQLNEMNKAGGASAHSTSTHYSVPQYASGGFPDEGELFMAREGGMPELVGRIGNRTAVANNDQIIQGISTGVFNAVVSAMSMSGGSGSDKNISIYLDGKEIAKTTTKYQRQYARAGTM